MNNHGLFRNSNLSDLHVLFADSDVIINRESKNCIDFDDCFFCIDFGSKNCGIVVVVIFECSWSCTITNLSLGTFSVGIQHVIDLNLLDKAFWSICDSSKQISLCSKCDCRDHRTTSIKTSFIIIRHVDCLDDNWNVSLFTNRIN